MLESLLSLDLPKGVLALIISSLPVLELRASIPMSINLFHFSWQYAFLLAIIGNMLPVPFLLLFYDTLSRCLARISIMKKPINWLFENTRRRGTIVEKYGLIGLLIFVALPVPMTGAWTASLLAVIFGLNYLPAFMAILGGVIIAGVIVTCLSLLGWVAAVIAGAGLIGITAFSIWKGKTRGSEEDTNPLITK